MTSGRQRRYPHPSALLNTRALLLNANALSEGEGQLPLQGCLGSTAVRTDYGSSLAGAAFTDLRLMVQPFVPSSDIYGMPTVSQALPSAGTEHGAAVPAPVSHLPKSQEPELQRKCSFSLTYAHSD